MAQAGRGPFADAVERQDGGLVERRGEERAGGVRFVMLGINDAAAVVGPPVPCESPAAGAVFAQARAGMARQNERKPAGANARYVSNSRSNFQNGLS